MTTPRDDLVALAPCPFCGGEAERIDIPTVGSDPDLGGDPNAGGSCISCKQCAASTALHFDRKENLYGSWNDRIAASRPATQVVDREAVARAICQSGKFETGEGTCALLCMDQLGSPRKKGCCHSARVHGKLANSILSLLRRAEPVEAERPDTVAQRTWFDGENIRTENLTADDIYQKPTTPDAVGEQATEAAVKEIVTHSPKSPDTSAAVIQSHALQQALNSLAEIASSHIPDCPAHYAGEELAWAQRHVGSLRHKAEIARNGIAAAIRQLPTSKD